MNIGYNDGRRIVCAANRFVIDDKEILMISARHWDARMREQASLYEEMFPDFLDVIHESEQGFIDTWGTFHSREDAMKIANHHKQIIRDIGYDSVELFSEHLY